MSDSSREEICAWLSLHGLCAEFALSLQGSAGVCRCLFWATWWIHFGSQGTNSSTTFLHCSDFKNEVHSCGKRSSCGKSIVMRPRSSWALSEKCRENLGKLHKHFFLCQRHMRSDPGAWHKNKLLFNDMFTCCAIVCPGTFAQIVHVAVPFQIQDILSWHCQSGTVLERWPHASTMLDWSCAKQRDWDCFGN